MRYEQVITTQCTTYIHKKNNNFTVLDHHTNSNILSFPNQQSALIGPTTKQVVCQNMTPDTIMCLNMIFDPIIYQNVTFDSITSLISPWRHYHGYATIEIYIVKSETGNLCPGLSIRNTLLNYDILKLSFAPRSILDILLAQI